MSLAYARARRDLGCRYTLGFYERDPKFDLRRGLTVSSNRPGLRVLHPEAYTFPSKKVVREASIRAAYLLPSRFRTGALRVHAFPVRPVDSKNWEALLVVEFPLEIGSDGTPAVKEFGAVVKSGSKVRHRFSRRLEVSATWPDGAGERTASFVERVELPEGAHEIVAVLSGTAEERPEAAEAVFDLPEVPKRVPLLPPPVLGHEVGDDVVVFANAGRERDGSDPNDDRLADRDDFRPVLLHRFDGADATIALSQACAPRKTRGLAGARLSRELVGADGSLSGTLPDVTFDDDHDASDRFRCVGALDTIPVPSLRPGEYRFRAIFVGDQGRTVAEAETWFEKLPRDEATAATNGASPPPGDIMSPASPPPAPDR